MECKFCGGLCDWVINGFDQYGTIRELACQRCGRWQDEPEEPEPDNEPEAEGVA